MWILTRLFPKVLSLSYAEKWEFNLVIFHQLELFECLVSTLLNGRKSFSASHRISEMNVTFTYSRTSPFPVMLAYMKEAGNFLNQEVLLMLINVEKSTKSFPEPLNLHFDMSAHTHISWVIRKVLRSFTLRWNIVVSRQTLISLQDLEVSKKILSFTYKRNGDVVRERTPRVRVKLVELVFLSLELHNHHRHHPSAAAAAAERKLKLSSDEIYVWGNQRTSWAYHLTFADNTRMDAIRMIKMSRLPPSTKKE